MSRESTKDPLIQTPMFFASSFVSFFAISLQYHRGAKVDVQGVCIAQRHQTRSAKHPWLFVIKIFMIGLRNQDSAMHSAVCIALRSYCHPGSFAGMQ